MSKIHHSISNNPILVVDDNPDIRRSLSKVLRNEGHTVIEAEDGDTALKLARMYTPSLVLLDSSMPGMDGEMVLAAMRQNDMGLPTVLMTTTREQQERASDLGAVLGLCKPFQVNELLQAVQRYKTIRKSDA